MKYNINKVNLELEEKIIINDNTLENQIGRIKKGDVVIIDKNNNENITKILKIFESNWLLENKKVFIYNCVQNIKIENYLFASVMNLNKIPNDLYEEIIEKKPIVWEKYKSITKDKSLYVYNRKVYNNFRNDMNRINEEIDDIDLMIIIENNLTDSSIYNYHFNLINCRTIILSDDYPKNLNYKYIKYGE